MRSGRQSRFDPTAAGGLAVLVWGFAIPLAKAGEDQVGIATFVGLVFGSMALIGVAGQLLRGGAVAKVAVAKVAVAKVAVLRQPMFYARWACFVLHEGLLAVAIGLVRREHTPVVILLNYLWPTGTLLCSMLMGGVGVRRRWAVVAGTALVMASLAVEILGPRPVVVGLFLARSDRMAYGLAVMGAAAWAWYSALSRRYGAVTGEATVLPLFQGTLGLAVLFPLLRGTPVGAGVTGGLLAALLGYSVLLYGAYLGWDTGVRSGNLVVLSLLADLIPLVSLLTTALLLRVGVPAGTFASAVVLIAGAVLTRAGTVQRAAAARGGGVGGAAEPEVWPADDGRS